MRQLLRAGQEIDILTRDELRSLIEEYRSGFLRPPQTERPEGGISLDSGGESAVGGQKMAVSIYNVPAGHTFRLHRAVFTTDVATFASPYTSATGFLEIRRGGAMQAGLGFAGTSIFAPGLPGILVAGTADGIEFRDGEDVELLVVDGPVSASLLYRLQGTLQPIVTE